MLPPNLVQLMRVEQLFQNIHVGRLSETRRLFKDIDHHDAVVLLESRNADLVKSSPWKSILCRYFQLLFCTENANPSLGLHSAWPCEYYALPFK